MSKKNQATAKANSRLCRAAMLQRYRDLCAALARASSGPGGELPHEAERGEAPAGSGAAAAARAAAAASLDYAQLKRSASPVYYRSWEALLRAEQMAAWLPKPQHLQQFA
jgi:hypothetical protein